MQIQCEGQFARLASENESADVSRLLSIFVGLTSEQFFVLVSYSKVERSGQCAEMQGGDVRRQREKRIEERRSEHSSVGGISALGVKGCQHRNGSPSSGVVYCRVSRSQKCHRPRSVVYTSRKNTECAIEKPVQQWMSASPERLLPSCYRRFHCSTDPYPLTVSASTLRSESVGTARYGTRNVVFLLVLSYSSPFSSFVYVESQMLFLSRHFLLSSNPSRALNYRSITRIPKDERQLCVFLRKERRSFFLRHPKKKEPTTELFSLIFSPKLNTIDIQQIAALLPSFFSFLLILFPSGFLSFVI